MMASGFRLLFARLSAAVRALKGGQSPRIQGRLGSARVAILTITEGEFEAARSVFGPLQNVPKTPYFVRTTSLSSNQYDIVLRRAAGQGNLEASMAVGSFVEDLRPEYVFLVGTAGGSGKDHGTSGDVAVADIVEYYEHRKYVAGLDLARRTPGDQPSLFLRERFVEPLRVSASWPASVESHCPRPEAGVPKLLIGEIVAGEKLLGDGENDFQARVVAQYDKAIAFDMESWGVAKEVYRHRSTPNYNLQYLIVRGLSDVVTSPMNDAMRVEWRDYAATAAAVVALHIINGLLENVQDLD